MSTHTSEIASIPIALCDADSFFDIVPWQEVLSGETRQVALDDMSSSQSTGIIKYYVEQCAETGSQSAQQQMRRHRLKDELLAHFLQRLQSGELLATGYWSGAPQRIAIESDLWAELKPNFVKSEARSKHHVFTNVQISLSPKIPATQESLTAWLRQKATEPEIRKKTLKAEALAELGPTVSKRLFDTCFQEVFARSRGRPKSTR